MVLIGQRAKGRSDARGREATEPDESGRRLTSRTLYDPTSGKACLKFGHIDRQSAAMYRSMGRRGKVSKNSKQPVAEGHSIHLHIADRGQSSAAK